CQASLPLQEIADGWCESCGKKLPSAVLAAAPVPRSARTPPPPPDLAPEFREPSLGRSLTEGFGRVSKAVKLIKLTIACVFCVLLGGWLALDPNLRGNPRQVTFQDVMPGLGAIIAGLVLLGLVVYFLIRSCKANSTLNSGRSQAAETDKKERDCFLT